MNKLKNEILLKLASSIGFVHSLESLTEEQWRTEIADGKWTIAEVIGHLIPWDEFLLESSLPYLGNDQELPPGPIEKEVNDGAARDSRNSSKEYTIERFISTRQKLQLEVMGIADELWEKEILIGKQRLTIYDYFFGFSQHDEHHFSQIKNIL